MCLDGNSAPASIRYLNSQLSALWKNAVDCAVHFGNKATLDLSSSSYKKSRYTRSLAQFHYAGDHSPRGPVHKEYLLFNGSFGKPRLQFICNHEAILHLNLQEGHLNTAVSKARSSTARVDIGENIIFDNVDIAVRLKFARRALTSVDPLIGNGGNIIQLLVLDFASAKIISHEGSIPRDIINFYVRQYLNLLRSAGHHVFFDLPDFDNNENSPVIDYSLGTTVKELDAYSGDIDIHGIHLTTINDLLRKSWLHAVAAATGLSGSPPADRLSTCLTEIKSIWLPSVKTHFHLKFNPPKVRALCQHEVVLYFNVDEVLFYESADFDLGVVEKYTGWEIAVIVSTVDVRDENGTVTGIKFDFNTARFCSQLSVFEKIDVALSYFDKIVQFITVEYVDLLIAYKLYELYVHEIDIYHESSSDTDSGSDVSTSPRPHRHGPIGNILVQSALYGFDQIITVSEESINTMFITLWKNARDNQTTKDDLLVEWSHESAFWGSFDAVKVKLLSDSQAIVRVNLVDGRMTLKDRYDTVSLSPWTIAFLVDIKLIDHREEDISHEWRTRYHGSHLGSKKLPNVKHLVLDFANAKFLLNHSSLTGLWDSGISSAVAKLHSIVHYISIYLNRVAHNGYNVIYSVPLSTEKNSGFSLTSLAFQVVSKTITTIHNRHRVRVAPVILLTGMSGHRSLPRVTLGWSEAWVVRKSFGTVILSRGKFLEGRLLPALASVNAKTTVLPRFPTVDEDEFSVYLSTLENHPYRRNKKTEWQLDRSSTSTHHREYVYKHRDEWTYEHSDSHHDIGAYSVLCTTNNVLQIPTVYHPGCMQVVLRGESVVCVAGKDETKKWSQKSTAKWSAYINVHSEWNGLRIEVAGPVNAEFADPVTTGDVVISAHDLLYKHLPKVVDVKEVIDELRATLQGVWEYSFPGLLTYSLANPVFTPNGDLVVQLRPYDPQAKLPTQLKKTNSNGTRTITTTTTTTRATAPKIAQNTSLFGMAQSMVQDAVRIADATLGTNLQSLSPVVFPNADAPSLSPVTLPGVSLPSVSPVSAPSLSPVTLVNTPVSGLPPASKLEIPRVTIAKPVTTLEPPVTKATNVRIETN